MKLFDGVTVDWGFSAADIFQNAMFLVGSVAAFVLLGLVIRYVPTLIVMIRAAAFYKKSTGQRLTASQWVEEFFATDAHIRERREKGRRYK